MNQPRKAADVVCFGNARKPHVLARVVVTDRQAPDLEVAPGVDWWAGETSGGGSLHLTCQRGHGEATVDLMDLAREVRSTARRVRRSVNSA